MHKEVNFNNHIVIYNDNVASVANVSTPILGIPFYNNLFLTSLRKSKAIIALIVYPSKVSLEFENIIKEMQSQFRTLQISRPKEQNKPFFDCKFSLILGAETDFQMAANLLTSAWLDYEYVQFYFSTDISELQYQEEIIKKTITKPAFNNKNLKSFFTYSKFEAEDIDTFVYKSSEVSFRELFTPDPILEIEPLLSSGILYNLDYSDEVRQSKELLDIALHEIELPSSFENKDFEIDIRSSSRRLIFNVQKNECVPLQLNLERNFIEFNIDRVESVFEISSKEKNKQKLKEKLRLVFYSKVNIEYKGNENSKIYFLDKSDQVIDKIIRCPFHGLLSKKDTFTYAPIYKPKG